MNNLELVRELTTVLSDKEIQTWVFGGWAEEISEIITPREHKDIDLLYPSEDFSIIDRIIGEMDLHEIAEKHFFHKRAFIYKGVMVELFLLQKDEEGYYTNFWGKNKYYWPENTLITTMNGFKLANKEALENYRKNYERLR